MERAGARKGAEPAATRAARLARSYGVAAASVGVALALRVVADPALGDGIPFITFFPAVAFAAWFGGFWPGVAATFASYLVADWFFVAPRGDLAIRTGNPPALFGSVAFVIVAVFIAWLSERLRRAERQARHKAAEVAQRAAEIEAILNGTPFMLTRCSRDLHYRFVSRAYAAMIGRTPEAVAGRPIVEIMGEKGLETIRPYLERVFRGEAAEYEGDVHFAGVGERTLHVSYVPEFDEAGEVSGWITSVLDVTERRRSEAEREDLLEVARKASGEAEGRLADMLTLVDVNRQLARTAELDELLPRLCRLVRAVVGADGATFVLREGDRVRYVAEDAIAPLWAGQSFPIGSCISGQAILEQATLAVEDVATDPRIPRELYRSTFARSLVMAPLRRDAEVVGAMGAYWSAAHRATPREVALLEAVVGAASAAVANARLFAEMRAARSAAEVATEELRRVQRIVEAMLGDLPLDELLHEVMIRVREALGTDVAVVLTGDLGDGRSDGPLRVRSVAGAPDAEIGFAPPPGEGFCGLVAVERRTLAWDEVEPERLALPFQRRMGVRALAGVPLVSDGQLLGVLEVGSVRPRAFGAGELELLRLAGERIALGIERAARRDAERRVREMLQAENRAKDEFLAMLGHELRNPLSAVRNAIATASLDESRRPRALAIARRQADQIARLIEDLLDVARITQGRITLRRERMDLAKVVEQAVETTRPFIEARALRLHLALAPEPIALDADPARLEQVLVNLLSNAAKYSDAGGRIELTTQRQGDAAIVRVRDGGIGIAPEMLPHIFDLFAQGPRTLDRAQGGLGIGLTVARRLVELHGGSIEAQSDGLGRGATLTVRVPALAREHEGPRPGAPGQAPPARPVSVLLVEDNPDAAESLVMLLELLGHRVRSVYDGAAALGAARERPPDAMLVDIGLPGIDGYEVARRIRREPGLAPVVLIALTGYGREEDERRAAAAGFDHHLVKPVDPDALQALLALARPVPEDRPERAAGREASG